ncbi:hypothetical protein B0T18DRAFT_190770 [Schizothecium vesticola]|uniref:Secreted protein n=1 Tax=Schizothecium vesticola TaxID=314040 RepID=A0AA40EQR9_9PEZI|nr:hypothetical protein B0T18DRAFT_190770 [Schizothecium vesticola]
MVGGRNVVFCRFLVWSGLVGNLVSASVHHSTTCTGIWIALKEPGILGCFSTRTVWLSSSFYTCFGGGIGSCFTPWMGSRWDGAYLQWENVIHKRLLGWLGRGKDCEMDRIEISVCSSHTAYTRRF